MFRMMFRYLVFPALDGWWVRLEDEERSARFDDFVSAERRARCLALRAAVKGNDSEILLFGGDGGAIGRWRGERYEVLRSTSGLAA
jgi:hypothetical protein